MAKCDICGEKISLTFLNKVVGTVVYDKDHKKKTVCPACQSMNKDKDLRDLL